jgi:hypothetical protein
MSIDHKAWLFDHSRFQGEVAPALFRSLSEDSVAPLRDEVQVRIFAEELVPEQRQVHADDLSACSGFPASQSMQTK